jgi:hypothetical protein
VARTTVPLDAELQSFRSEDEELRRRTRSIREAIEKIEDDLAALQGDIKGLEVRGSVPTREAVVGERATRNALWLGIRRHFMPTPGEKPCRPTRRRRPSATSVPSAAPMTPPTDCSPMPNEPPVTPSFGVRESQMQNALGLERERAASVAREQQDLDRRWAALLAAHSLPPLKIGEAAPWVARREAFLQKFDASQAKRQEARQHRELAWTSVAGSAKSTA